MAFASRPRSIACIPSDCRRSTAPSPRIRVRSCVSMRMSAPFQESEFVSENAFELDERSLQVEGAERSAILEAVAQFFVLLRPRLHGLDHRLAGVAPALQRGIDRADV